MSEKPGVFSAIRRENEEVSEHDLSLQEYEKMVENARNNPNSINKYMSFIGKILEPCTEDWGELVLSNNNPCFELQGRPFTNFGVLLLLVIKIHFLDRVEHFLELLIWGKHLPPKIIRVDARELRSSRWLDDLGPQYICEGVSSLKYLIKTMSLYAPSRDDYG